MGFKQFMRRMIDGNVQHPTPSWYGLSIPRTRFDYAREVGTGLGSNVIMSPVQWVMRTFPEAPVKLEKILVDGKTDRVFDHPFLTLIGEPNEFYTYETMIMAIMLSWSISGNAYLLKVRNGIGQVVELWYVPHWMIIPKGDEADQTIFIDHYVYNPNGTPFEIPREDIIHFRFGLNPENIRTGLSPLGAVIREVFTDDEASNYSASMLRNMGVPGVIISPSKEDVEIDEDGIKEIKEKFKQSFNGDNRGEAMVMTGPTKVDTFGFDPKQMALPDVRDISEERICAALGIPAAVVGFGSGLQQTKVGATMMALIKLAWQGNIIPSQRIISQTLQKQLLPDFDNDTNLIVCYDNSGVAALQEDKNERRKLLLEGVGKGATMVSEFKEEMGLPFNDSDKVYLRPLGLVEIDGG